MERRLPVTRVHEVPSGLSTHPFEADGWSEMSEHELGGYPDCPPVDLGPTPALPEVAWQHEPVPPALSPHQEELVTTHYELAKARASQFVKRYGLHSMSEDLTQAACELLMRSVRNFNPKLAPPSGFAGYLTSSIDQGLKTYLRDHGWVVRTTRDKKSALSNNPDDPSLENVRSARRPISLDKELPRGGTQADMLVDERIPFDEQFCELQLLREALARLPERERKIVELYYFKNMSQVDVASEVGLSQMQVSRLLRRSASRLADFMAS